MITTEPIRQEAQKLEEFDLDSCSDYEINKMLKP